MTFGSLMYGKSNVLARDAKPVPPIESFKSFETSNLDARRIRAIVMMRRDGFGYKAISERVGISQNNASRFYNSLQDSLK